jgi:hypothetical protein
MLCLSYYAYVFSSTKSVIRAEQDLPETEGVGGKGGEMTQTMYVHVHKRTKKINKFFKKRI